MPILADRTEQVPPGIVLRVDCVDVYYGEVAAVQGASLEISEREIVCILGPNGAGKTTLLKAIVGFVKPKRGSINFLSNGSWTTIHNLEPYERAKLGICTVAAAENVLPRFTVEENLRIGAYLRTDKAQIKRDIEAQFERFSILRDRRKQLAGTLSGGEQKICSIARAMMARPKFLVLDEPSLGLSPHMMDIVFQMIREVNRENELECLLVEQNVRKALEVSDRAYVMRIGGIEFSAPSSELASGSRIEEAYFGAGRK